MSRRLPSETPIKRHVKIQGVAAHMTAIGCIGAPDWDSTLASLPASQNS
jgi:hypothetical protein